MQKMVMYQILHHGGAGNIKTDADGSYVELTWKVVAKDLKNTTVTVDKEENVTVMNGSVVVPSKEYDVKFSEDGKKVTVTAKADSKNYTGSKEVDVDAVKVGAPVINTVKVSGNKATVILSDEADGASGYDYVSLHLKILQIRKHVSMLLRIRFRQPQHLNMFSREHTMHIAMLGNVMKMVRKYSANGLMFIHSL